MRNKIILLAMLVLFVTIFAVSCQKQGKENAETDAGGTVIEEMNSVKFRNYAVDGSEVIYTEYPEHFTAETASLPAESNYFAIYQGTLYYVDTPVGTETGEIAGGKCRIIAYPLDQEKLEKTEILSLEGITALAEITIQDGLLYCSYFTGEDELKCAAAELAGGSVRSAVWPEKEGTAYPVTARDAEWVYYEDGLSLFRCDYEGKNETLVYEFPKKPELIVLAGKRFYAVQKDENGVSFISFDKTGKDVKNYTGFAAAGNGGFSFLRQQDAIYLAYDAMLYQINETTGELMLLKNISSEDITVGTVVLISISDKNLYYLINGSEAEGTDNTFFVRMNLEDNTKEICGGWYTP